MLFDRVLTLTEMKGINPPYIDTRPRVACRARNPHKPRRRDRRRILGLM